MLAWRFAEPNFKVYSFHEVNCANRFKIGFEEILFRGTTTLTEVLAYIDLGTVYFTVWELE
jgi:hypothetical protein